MFQKCLSKNDVLHAMGNIIVHETIFTGKKKLAVFLRTKL